jgi:hypothetical protein
MGRTPLELFNLYLKQIFMCIDGDDGACLIADQIEIELGLDKVRYREGD